jgi:hypothetical protein
MTILNLMVYRHCAFYSPIPNAIAGGFLAGEGFEATYAVMPPQRSVGEMRNDVERDGLPLGLVAPEPYSAETVRAWCEAGLDLHRAF